MKKIITSLAILLSIATASSQQDDLTLKNMEDEDEPRLNKQKGEPLEGMDVTWWNGGNRRSKPTLAGKHFTPVVMVDANYTH